jgi:hypothetical protein
MFMSTILKYPHQVIKHKIYGPLSRADKSVTNWLIPHIHEADDFITQQDGMPPHIYLKM